MAQRREPTQTSAFGVSRRESHDASAFYARFAAPDLSDDNAVHPDKAIDRLIAGDARAMGDVPSNAVALVVTSPPYFAGKEYEEALGEGHIPATYLDYLAMLEDVFAECVRTLEPGGRIAVNVANLGRRPYRSLSSDVTTILQDKLRLLLRGEVIWQKARASTGSCAWGSFRQPANPVLRDVTERVVIASKGRFDRALSARQRQARGLPSAASLSTDEFMDATTDIWEIPSDSATRVGHPAPFPVALPERLIHLYTYYGDLVLDPFMGSGSTAVAAVRTRRHYVGYDTDPGYVDLARRRVEEERRAIASAPTALPSAAARALAGDLLASAGFRSIEPKVRLRAGLDLSFRAADATGAPWLFEVAGGFTASRPGLQRSETLWKVLGKAAVAHEVAPGVPLVLLTPEPPAAGSPGAAALAAVTGPGRPIRAVVAMTSPQDLAQLAHLAHPATAQDRDGG